LEVANHSTTNQSNPYPNGERSRLPLPRSSNVSRRASAPSRLEFDAIGKSLVGLVV